MSALTVRRAASLIALGVVALLPAAILLELGDWWLLSFGVSLTVAITADKFIP